MAEVLQPFVCGGLSACFASACVHPIDLAKVRLQLFATLNPGQPKPGFGKILSEMVKQEGFFSIYAGLSASLARQSSYGTARIGFHRSISDYLVEQNKGRPLPFFTKALSGMASGAIAVCIGTPMDVALVRMQADSMKPKDKRRGYKNVFDALKRVMNEEGFLKLYSGLLPNILRGVSINVGMLACYDQAKEFISVNIFKESMEETPSMRTQISASLVAGFTASLLRVIEDGGKARGLTQTAADILAKEGVLAFWTGLGAYYARTAPHAMIVLLTAESITEAYKKLVLQILHESAKWYWRPQSFKIHKFWNRLRDYRPDVVCSYLYLVMNSFMSLSGFLYALCQSHSPCLRAFPAMRFRLRTM